MSRRAPMTAATANAGASRGTPDERSSSLSDGRSRSGAGTRKSRRIVASVDDPRKGSRRLLLGSGDVDRRPAVAIAATVEELLVDGVHLLDVAFGAEAFHHPLPAHDAELTGTLPIGEHLEDAVTQRRR